MNACSSKKSKVAWDQSFSIIGSQSSPRAADLNGDGILDIVMGAGKNEYVYSERGVLALNGRDGEIIWQQDAQDQVFGSATFLDITGDEIPDVFIGGRSPNYRALDGRNGNVLWAYDTSLYADDPILKYARCNFYNSQVIPDQDGDGIEDILIVNGGNPIIAPYVQEGRVPGVLMIFSAVNGKILAADTMPDGRESYMSPIVFRQPEADDLTVIFGSGGETLDGNLYMTTLTDLRNQNLVNAKILASDTTGHGFIAPPVAADINKDGYYDIVAISHGSTIFAINGKDQSIIWKQNIEGTETSNSFGVGYFTGDDDVPDFFTFVHEGVWPDNYGTNEIVLDGKDGHIAYRDSIGCTAFSSAVVYDLNHDGNDEVIISVNDFDCSLGFLGQTDGDQIANRIIAIEFKKGTQVSIDRQERFKNIFSTPWIGDIDGDDYLDIVFCQYFSVTPDPLVFLGMKVKRISSNVAMDEDPVWGAYMGSDGSSVFPK